jgi:hypothetical protein
VSASREASILVEGVRRPVGRDDDAIREVRQAHADVRVLAECVRSRRSIRIGPELSDTFSATVKKAAIIRGRRRPEPECRS